MSQSSKPLSHHRQFLGTDLVLAAYIATAFGCASNTTGTGPQPNAPGDSTGGTSSQQNSSATVGGMLGAAGSSASGGATSTSTTGKAGGIATGGSSGISTSSTGGTSSQGGTANNNAGGKTAGGSSSTATTGGRSSTGGAGNGGSSTGGKSDAGTSTGGKNTGGKSSTGGTGNGGSSTGGKNAGGTNTGGAPAAGGSGNGSCNFTVDVKLASAVKSNSPGTIGIVTWSVNGITPNSANIKFGLDAAYGMTAPVDLTVANYQTPLLGMKPSKTYHFQVVATDGSTTCTSQDYSVTTEAKTTSVSISNFSVKNESARKRGFIVTSYWNGSGKAVPFILDADGDIVWWYAGGPSGGIARARMSVDAKNMWIVGPSVGSGTPVQRVSMDTLDPQTYSSTSASHDIAAVSDSTMAYIDYSKTCNGIVEIDPSGTTKQILDATTILSTTAGCHGNALRYSKTEDVYTYSDVQTDVYVVSRKGALQWKLSQKVSSGHSAWGGVQHGHQLLDNSIIIFANSGSSGSASAAIEYGLDGSLIKKFTSGGYTQNLGDVQRLPGGNTLITYGNGYKIQEVDSSGNLVLEITGGTSSFGYAEWRESLYGAPMDIAE